MQAILSNPVLLAALTACGGVGGIVGFLLRGSRSAVKTELVLAAEEVEAARLAMEKAKATPDPNDDAVAAKQFAAAEAHRKALRRLQGLVDGLAGGE